MFDDRVLRHVDWAKLQGLVAAGEPGAANFLEQVGGRPTCLARRLCLAACPHSTACLPVDRLDAACAACPGLPSSAALHLPHLPPSRRSAWRLPVPAARCALLQA